MNNSSITKYIVGGVLIVAVVGYLILGSKSSVPVAATPVTTTSDNTATTTASSTSSTGSGTSTTTTTTASGKYKDGTYTSQETDAFYGKVQVAITVKGGAITDVEVPVYPSDGESARISGAAVVTLKQEALTSQGASVNIVSGATQTSQAFQQALASLLVEAKA